MNSLLFELGCAQINFADGSLTCKKQAMRNLRKKQKRAKLAVIKEYGKQYDYTHRRASVSRFAPI